MKTIEPRRDRIVVGSQSLDAIEAEWREWSPDESHRYDVVPSDWLTTEQIAEIKGKSRRQIERDLKADLHSGRVERKLFRLRSSQNCAVKVTHWRRVRAAK